MLEVVEKPDAPPGVKTRLMQQVRAGVNIAMMHMQIVALQGPVGIGKTTALRAEAERLRAQGHRVALITARPEIAGNIKTIYNEALTETAGFYCGGVVEAAKSFRETFALSPCEVEPRRGVVMVDEAQNLGPKVLEALRCSHDDRGDGSGFGLVLSGNLGFIDRHGRARTANFAQLSSRIAARIELAPPTADEIEMVFRAAGDRFAADALGDLVAFGVAVRNLRAPLKVLMHARAGAGGGEIQRKHVRAGIKLVRGDL